MSEDRLRWVALDGMGVLYAQRAIPDRLRAFAAAHGAPVALAEVRELYWAASRGSLRSADLWERLGIPGAGRDAQFLSGRSLTPGLGAFLEAMTAQGIPVGCISNDVAAWSTKLRRQLGLEELIEPWIVSAEVGARKPDRRMYDAFLARTGCRPGECLMVDDKLENLDAARRLGFRTAWFSAHPARSDHPRVGSFATLQDLIFRKQPTSVG